LAAQVGNMNGNTDSNMGWSVYMIRCDDGSLYTGISTNVERRFREHRDQPRGAKFFNGRQPLEVVWREDGHTRSSAARCEAAIKKLSRERKLLLIN
jgi:putative endonuclease